MSTDTKNIENTPSKSLINTPEEYTKEFFIEKTVYKRFVEFTRRYSHTEWGGVLLGTFSNDTFRALVAILPPQTTQNAVYCEFKREFFVAISRMRDNLEKKGFNKSEIPLFGCWIHTHPKLTAFLSGTDQATFKYLASMNPKLTAIVIDPVSKDEVCVNSVMEQVSSTKRKYVKFSEIPIQQFTITNSASEEMFKAIIEEVRRPYFSKLMQVKQSINVFTPIGEYECLYEIMESKFDELHELIHSGDQLLLQENQFHEPHMIKAQIPALRKFNFNTTEYITNYQIYESGIIINQLNSKKNPYCKFISWDSIRSIFLCDDFSYVIHFEFVLTHKKSNKAWLDYFKFLSDQSIEKTESLSFFTRQPNELVSIFTKYIGSIKKKPKQLVFQDEKTVGKKKETMVKVEPEKEEVTQDQETKQETDETDYSNNNAKTETTSKSNEYKEEKGE